MKFKKVLAMGLAAALCITSLVGCSSNNASSNSSSSSSQESVSKREERKKNNELIVAIGEEPEAGFDATTGGHGSITRVFFSTLFKRDKKLGFENDLATGYKVSDDKLTWTVTIRDDAKFTDGEKVTAQDVAFTYQTAKESGSEIDLTMIDKITAKDHTTIEFKLNRTYSAFMERLAYLGIVPEHAYDENFKDNPIGSGPYEFVQWDKGQQVIAKANENYYGDKPQIKQLTMVFLDTDAAYSTVQKGDVDVCQINGNLADKKVDGAKVIDIDSIECYGVEFPMQKSGKKAKDGYEMGNNVTSDEAI